MKPTMAIPFVDVSLDQETRKKQINTKRRKRETQSLRRTTVAIKRRDIDARTQTQKLEVSLFGCEKGSVRVQRSAGSLAYRQRARRSIWAGGRRGGQGRERERERERERKKERKKRRTEGALLL